MRKAFWILLTLAFASTVQAAEPSRVDARTVVRVDVSTARGSGVYIGSRLVLTAHHVVRGYNVAAVTFTSGPRISGKIVANDVKWDQALIELQRDPQWPAARIAQQDIGQGEYVQMGGYPATGKMRDRQAFAIGRVTGYKTCSSTETQADWVTFSATVPQGCSGGPVFNRQGEVLGVLWGSSQGERMTAFCRPGRTRAFLKPYKSRLIVTPCPTGTCPQPMIGQDSRQVFDPPAIEQPSIMPGNLEPPEIVMPEVPVIDTPAPKPEPKPTPIRPCCTDCDKLAALADRVAALQKTQESHTASLADLDARTKEASTQAASAATAATGAQSAAEAAQASAQQNQAGLTALTERVTTIEQRLTGLESVTQDGTSVLEQAIAEQAKLLAQIQAMQTQLSVIQQGLEHDQTTAASTLKDVMLYYTSREATGVAGVDAKIAAMKAKGAPIIVTYLKPTQAEVFGIPRIFIPSQNKNVVGVANCEYYLASLLPR